MSLLGYEATIASLLNAGVPRDKAEARARELYPDVAAQLDVEIVRKANVLEKAEQNAIRKMALALGMRYRSTSQARAAKVSPDFPDLWLAWPERQLCFWWETKRSVGGKRTSGQVDFAAECEAAGIPYGFGDRFEFAKWLTARGITPPAIPTD